MKDVTIAKGQLRCGECLNVFNAVDTLSTSMPEKFASTYSDKEIAEIKKQDELQTSDKQITKQQTDKAAESSNKSDYLFLASLFLLTFLLAAQVLYHNPSLYSDKAPVRAPDKIKMLNYNVFAHPGEAGVLLISGSMKNNAKHAQPYPVLEIALSDKQNKLVAFSRFTPQEYLSSDTHATLFPTDTPVNLRLKIKDPGSNATQFKFSFK